MSLVVEQVDLPGAERPTVLDRVVGVRVDGLPMALAPGTGVEVAAVVGEAGFAVTFTVLAGNLAQVDP